MLIKRSFRIVLVGENHGTGVDVSGRADKELSYEGKMLEVKF
jgi:hypothetical protein